MVMSELMAHARREKISLSLSLTPFQRANVEKIYF
jgi:hypothetical protein